MVGEAMTDPIGQLQFDGQHEPRFEPLAQCFADNFTALNETGAALAVFYRGKLALHRYGSLDSANGPWQPGDRVCTMSASKAPLALCLHLLAERGQIDLLAPVADYWPEFGVLGKERIKIEQVLNHTSGLPAIKNVAAGDIFNWSTMTRALAESPLVFEPGTRLAYHALTFGHLVGELIRRVDGRMPGDFFHEEISRPYGIDYDLRCFAKQPIRPINAAAQFKPAILWLYSRLALVVPHWKMQYFRPCNADYYPNSKAWQGSEIPAVTGQGSALGLARLYAFLAGGGWHDGQRLCREETVAGLGARAVALPEAATGQRWRMGQGFMFNSPDLVAFGPNASAFGHVGMGGAAGFADPDNQLAFAYVTERYHQPHKGDKSMAGRRLQRLIGACYQSLGAEATPA